MKEAGAPVEPKILSYRGQVWGKIGLAEQIAQIVFGSFMVHYFLWPIFMGLGLYALYLLGFGWLSVLLFLAYIPSFFNNDHRKTGRVWHWLRTHPIWKLTQRYLEMELVREAPLDPSHKYIFGIYPHGILVLSRLGMYGGAFEELFPGIETRVLGATPMFYTPGARELCLWMGAVDASKSTASRILKQGLSLMVYPGGSKEIFLTNPNSKDTILIARNGFVRLALEHGAHIVPTFVFGEKWCYKKKELPKWFRDFFMKALRVPLLLFWGRFFTWLPLQRRMSIVFGRPIEVPRVDKPTSEQVAEIHRKFVAEIERIFSLYRDRYGYDNDERLVWRNPSDQY